MMKIAILLAAGALALAGSSANASERSDKVQATAGTSQVTDFSSRRRYRTHYYRHSYVPYRRYGYAPQPYYGGYGYAPGYYGGGPVVSFSLGGGGYRGGGWGHRW